jgi:hypothetical protein
VNFSWGELIIIRTTPPYPLEPDHQAWFEKFAQDVRMVEQDLKNLKSIIEEGN